MRASFFHVFVAIAKSEAEHRSHLNHPGVAAEHAIKLSEIGMARSQVARGVGQSGARVDIVDLPGRVLRIVEGVAEVGAYINEHSQDEDATPQALPEPTTAKGEVRADVRKVTGKVKSKK